MSCFSCLLSCCFGSAKIAVEPSSLNGQQDIQPARLPAVGLKITLPSEDEQASPAVDRVQVLAGGLPRERSFDKRHQRLSSLQAAQVDEKIRMHSLAKQMAGFGSVGFISPAQSRVSTPVSREETELYLSSCRSTPSPEPGPNRATPSTEAMSSEMSGHVSLDSSNHGER